MQVMRVRILGLHALSIGMCSVVSCLCSVWEVVAAKHATSSQSSEHAVVVAYVSDKDPWSRSMGNSTLACEPPATC